MALAGLAVARLALATAPHAHTVEVWAGPGNNGGDGLVAARHLHRAGKHVRVHLVADAGALPADAARALHEAMQDGVAVDTGIGVTAPCGLVIDALLGLGVSRAPSGPLAQAIAHINQSRAPVLAVDIPSGLHPDTGSLLGEAAVRAQSTLALLTLKPGCFTHQGRDHAGEVWLHRLGVDAGAPTAWLSDAPQRSPRRHGAHKGSFGDVAVVGGAAGMVGAAWLAASAALTAGAGRVYCSLVHEGLTLAPSARPELMMRSQWWLQPVAILSDCTVVCGCGGGDAVRHTLSPLLSHAARLVLDADALNAISADTSLQRLLALRARKNLPTLLTPHPLEAARLLGGLSAADVQHDRVAAAQSLAARFGATVLLKGSGSVIAAPASVPVINSSGNAALATAGTGDVLAGWVGGLWAQHSDRSAAEMAVAAAWQHGHAADRFAGAHPNRALRAGDLIEELRLGD